MKGIDLTEKKIGHHAYGAWVAISRDVVVAEGATFEEAYDKAIAMGVKKPLIASTVVPPSTMIL